MNSSRDKILNAIKEATKIPSHLPEKPEGVEERIKAGLDSITPKNYTELRDQFQKELELVQAEFHLAHNRQEIVDIVSRIMKESNYTSLAVAGNGVCQEIGRKVTEAGQDIELVRAIDFEGDERKQKLAVTQAAFVDAEYAVADIGSLVVIYDDTPSSLPHFLPDTIFIMVRPEQLLANLFELFEKLPTEKARNMTLITGPSRTADVEKILVLGAHGPRRMVVFMLEEAKA